jgi:hypothetical protein
VDVRLQDESEPPRVFVGGATAVELSAARSLAVEVRLVERK